MNKKILLGSLVAVGLLAGCSPVVPSSSTTKPSEASSASSSSAAASSSSAAAASSSSAAASSAAGASSSEAASSSASSVTPIVTGGTNLTIALNYDGNNNRITYQKDQAYSTPNGKEVKKGDYKPVWVEVQKKNQVNLIEVEKACTSKAVNYFKSNWKTDQYADLAAANVSDINTFSVDGTNETILDLNEYLDRMPNFKALLDANPAVKMSITSAKHGDATRGAIYYLPYFDGYNDLEKMTLIRADYVRKLFSSTTTLDTNKTLLTSSSYVATEADASGNAKAYTVTVPKNLTSNETKVITKAAVKNIIARQNETIAAGNADAATLVAQFKQYVSERYGTQFADVADLFLGVDSCYDADEMVALMRIAKVAPKALTGDEHKKVVPFVPRQQDNQRAADLYRWGGQLWGVRGVESRSGYLYFAKDGKLHDLRGEEDVTGLLDNLNKIYNEGLIVPNFESANTVGVSDGKYAQNLLVGHGTGEYVGLMEYDYAQSQGAWNDKAASKAISDYDLRPILGGVANWDDGDSSTSYYHFTESWRSIKTQGLVLNAALKNNPEKLTAALKVADFFYGEEGHTLNSFGPESEGYTSGTIDYQGRKVAKFTEDALAQFNDSAIGAGNYTNYLRTFVGATLPVGYIKEQGMEYQMTTAHCIAGLDIINKAIEVGTYKHVIPGDVTNMFFKMVPSSFFFSANQATDIAEAADKTKLGSIQSNSGTTDWCLWDAYVMNGFGTYSDTNTTGTRTKADYLTMINTTWELKKILKHYQDAYDFLND